MKIAIVGSNRIDSMEFHFSDAFQNAGHESKIFDIYDGFPYTIKSLKLYFQTFNKVCRIYSDRYDVNVFAGLAKKINAFTPDLVICFYKDIHPSFVKKVKSTNNKVIHINPDQMSTLGYQQVIAAEYDAWFTKDSYMFDFMKNKAGMNVYLYNEAFNQRFNPKPNCDKRALERETKIDVMTYGTLYPYRTRMMKKLIDAGVDIKLYGTIPHRFFNNEVASHCMNKYIVGNEKARLLYGSKIVFNNFHFAEVNSVNCRFFEANGCGAFQLSDYRPILKKFLPIDPLMVSYKNIDEGVDKIKYYLNHEKERIEIANVVYEHFIHNYTYDSLVRDILNIVRSL